MENTWSDRVYLIKPKHHNLISKQYEIIPEQRLGLSSEFIFPNPDKRQPDPIKMLDAINGYKFGLSFHLSSINDAKCYFYHGPGVVLFKLNDMKWLWPKYFVKHRKSKQLQSLDATIVDEINRFNQNNKYFKDAKFEQFQKQTKNKQSFQ